MRFWKLAILGILGLSLLAACGPVGNDRRTQSEESHSLAGGGIGGTGDGGDDGGDDSDNNGGGDTSGGTDGDAGVTSLKVTLAGRQAPWIDSLVVTLEGIDLHIAGEAESEDGGWVEINSDAQSHDILQLTDGERALLCDAPVADTAFDKIRVRIGNAAISVSGATYEMQLLSAAQDIDVLPEALAPDEAGRIEIDLDFDALVSVKLVAGRMFKLQPEINVVDWTSVGSISGHVTPIGVDSEVSAYNSQNGALVAAVRVREDGTFTIPHLTVLGPSGAALYYTLEASADGYTVNQTYANIVVAAGADSDGYDFVLDPVVADELATDDPGRSDDSGHSGDRGHRHGSQ